MSTPPSSRAGKPWTDSYSKFDTLDSDDSDSEEATPPPPPPLVMAPARGTDSTAEAPQRRPQMRTPGPHTPSSMTATGSNTESRGRSGGSISLCDGRPVPEPSISYDFAADSEFMAICEKGVRVRSLPQAPLEVWQVTCCRLRCWTGVEEEDDEEDDSDEDEEDEEGGGGGSGEEGEAAFALAGGPGAERGGDMCGMLKKQKRKMPAKDKKRATRAVRPWAVLVACIYPDSGLRLLGYDVNPDAPDSDDPRLTVPRAARCVARLMKDPPYGAQRRPGKVVCHDAHMGAGLFRCLASLKVDCSLLPALPQAIRAHADAVATIYLKAGGASPGYGGPTAGDDDEATVVGGFGPLLTPWEPEEQGEATRRGCLGAGGDSDSLGSRSGGSGRDNHVGSPSESPPSLVVAEWQWRGLFEAAHALIAPPPPLSLAPMGSSPSPASSSSSSSAATAAAAAATAAAAAVPRSESGWSGDDDDDEGAEEEESGDEYFSAKGSSDEGEAETGAPRKPPTPSPPSPSKARGRPHSRRMRPCLTPWGVVGSGLGLGCRHAVIKVTLTHDLSGTGLSGTGLSGTGLSGTGLSGTGLSGTGLSGTGTAGTGGGGSVDVSPSASACRTRRGDREAEAGTEAAEVGAGAAGAGEAPPPYPPPPPPLLRAGSAIWVGLVQDDGDDDGGQQGVLGLAVFFSRLDAEARLKDRTTPMAALHRPYAPTPDAPPERGEVLKEERPKGAATSAGEFQTPRPPWPSPPRCCAFQAYLDATSTGPGQAGARAGAAFGGGAGEKAAEAATNAPAATKLKRTKPRSFDVRSGAELAYASASALRAHWPEVRAWSRPLSERDEGLSTGRTHWHPQGEAALLFTPLTQAYLPDLDFALDNLHLPTLSSLAAAAAKSAEEAAEAGSGTAEAEAEAKAARRTTKRWRANVRRAARSLGRSPDGLFPTPLRVLPPPPPPPPRSPSRGGAGGSGPGDGGGTPRGTPTRCDAATVAWLTIAARVAARLPELLPPGVHQGGQGQRVRGRGGGAARMEDAPAAPPPGAPHRAADGPKEVVVKALARHAWADGTASWRDRRDDGDGGGDDHGGGGGGEDDGAWEVPLGRAATTSPASLSWSSAAAARVQVTVRVRVALDPVLRTDEL